MRKSFLSFHLKMVATAMAGIIFLAAYCLAQPQAQPGSKQEDSVKKFLQAYVGTTADDKKTFYFSTFVDLKDDGNREVIVCLTNDGWCGSGGCTTLILAPADSSYRVVKKITVTRPPIRVLTTKSNGWHDIAVQVQGGGITDAYEARLSFDGRAYPGNPSIPPAQRLTEKAEGKVVVPLTAGGTPLY